MYMGRSRPSRRLSPANPARGLRVRDPALYNARTPETGTNRLGGSFDSSDAKAVEAANLAGRGDPRKPRLTGEGDFVSTGHPSKPSEERKRRKSAFAEISSATADPPRCSGTPTPDEKARRLAVLRAVLADSAPAFQARARRAGEGQP